MLTQALLRDKFAGDLRHVHPAPVVEFVNEGGLFQNAQGSVVGGAQQAQDRGRFVGTQRTIGHGGQAQLACAAIPLKAVEQDAWLCLNLHSFQRFLDAALGDRRQKPFFLAPAALSRKPS